MPRTRRVDGVGTVHHVMVRGVDRTSIVHDDADRARFVDQLGRLAREEEARLYAWALMPNHAHLVVRSGPPGVSRLMARLGTSHARAFNTRYGRVGHLFQDRFRSVLVESDTHLRWLLRYVHRNPIEAGLVRSVAELADYPWTGHAELIGPAPRPLLAASAVLEWFAPDRDAAIRALLEWMDEPAEHDTPDAEVLHDSELARRAVARAVARAAGHLGVDTGAVLAGSRSRLASQARATAIRELVEVVGLPAARVERELGLARGAASRARRRASDPALHEPQAPQLVSE